MFEYFFVDIKFWLQTETSVGLLDVKS